VSPEPEKSQEELEREEIKQRALKLMDGQGDRFEISIKLLLELYNFARVASGLNPV
jgi:hypothetical protein